jgi:hypothetical protein
MRSKKRVHVPLAEILTARALEMSAVIDHLKAALETISHALRDRIEEGGRRPFIAC